MRALHRQAQNFFARNFCAAVAALFKRRRFFACSQRGEPRSARIFQPSERVRRRKSSSS